MTYQILNNGAAIIISSDVGQRWVMKENVKQLLAQGNDYLKIVVGNPGKAIFLPYQQISTPVCDNAMALRDLINTWITEYIQSNTDSGGGGTSFTAGNGVSLSSTGELELGNDPGATDATLTTDREIPMNGHQILFTSVDGRTLSLDENGISVASGPAEVPAKIEIAVASINLTGRSNMGSPAQILLGDDSSDSIISTMIYRREDGLAIRPQQVNAPFIFKDNGKLVYTGPANIPADYNDGYADFNCNTTASFQKPVKALVSSAGATTGWSGNIIYSNKGATQAIEFYLVPNGVGCFYTFCVQENHYFNIYTQFDCLISVAGLTDATGIQSTTIGSTITLCLIDDQRWVAIAMTGTWTMYDATGDSAL